MAVKPDRYEVACFTIVVVVTAFMVLGTILGWWRPRGITW